MSTEKVQGIMADLGPSELSTPVLMCEIPLIPFIFNLLPGTGEVSVTGRLDTELN